MHRSLSSVSFDSCDPVETKRHSEDSVSRSRYCFQMHSIEKQQLEPSHLFLETGERLLLPRRGSAPCLDEYLSSVPHVVSRADELMEACNNNDTSTEQLLEQTTDSSICLNVLQGEVAHASALQADVVVSAEATTCHVVVLRSTKNSESVPLVSVAHIDKANVYDACLEKMVKEHLNHHEKAGKQANDDDQDFGFFVDENDEQEKNQVSSQASSFLPGLGFDRRTASMPSFPVEAQAHDPIEMDLHMVGGFLDTHGRSQELSTSLVERFNDLAEKYRGRLKISLSTAAISSLNNNCNDGDKPRSRGLGIETKTGNVFPVTSALPEHLAGPAVEVRSARAFADEPPALSVIHDAASQQGDIRVEPFSYKQHEELNVLLKLPDDVLLSVTSTSPDQESDQFCSNFRRTLSFVNTVPPETVFEDSKPLVYTRSATNLNEWEEVAPTF